MGQLNAPANWARLHRSFDAVPTETNLMFVNDDLVGFSTLSLKKKHSFFDSDPATIMVDVSATGNPIQSTFSGSHRQSTHNLKKIYVKDIFSTVRSSLSSMIFSALGCF